MSALAAAYAALGYDAVATGHYAQLVTGEDGLDSLTAGLPAQ